MELKALHKDKPTMCGREQQQAKGYKKSTKTSETKLIMVTNKTQADMITRGWNLTGLKQSSEGVDPDQRKGDSSLVQS